MFETIRALMITSEYPTPEKPHSVPFIVRQAEFLRRAGVVVDVFHFKGDKKFGNYLAARRRLQKHIHDRHYTVAHAQWGQSAALAVLPKRLPLVITFRGNDLEGIVGKNGKITFLGLVQRNVSKLMARLADEVIVVSESLGRHLARKDFHVIPSGLDMEMFRPMPQAEARAFLNLPKDKRLILFAASTIENPRKRYSLAKEAVERLAKRFDAELVVANNVPHFSVPYFMNACDALLLTSVHEGSPNVVKEALACNLPVVSVNVGDVAERAGRVDGCVVCPDSTVEAIAAGLEKVLSERRRIDGTAAIRDLNEEVIARRVIEVYKKAMLKADSKKRIPIAAENDKKRVARV